jgi:hypothetical protein
MGQRGFESLLRIDAVNRMERREIASTQALSRGKAGV